MTGKQGRCISIPPTFAVPGRRQLEEQEEEKGKKSVFKERKEPQERRYEHRDRWGRADHSDKLRAGEQEKKTGRGEG